MHNVFDQDCCSQLGAGLDKANANPDVGAIVVTGAGTKAFSAGFDLAYADANPEVYRTPLFGSEVFRRPPSDKPIVAAVNGLALGMDFEFVLACDLIVADPKASFALPEVSAIRSNFRLSQPSLARLSRSSIVPSSLRAPSVI